MANKPFDQRVINELERPTSSDLNIAQSQLNLNARAMMRQLLQPNPLAVGTGSLGESFFVEKTTGTRNFKIKRGVGFNYVATSGADYDIGGIDGVSDPFDYRMVSAQDEAGVPVTIPAGTNTNFCRRDVIAIRCGAPNVDRLTDTASTDIYDVSSNVFAPDDRFKTYTYDISGQTPQVLDYDQIASATDPVVYIRGQTIAYTGPDSLLSAPAPVLSSPYINIAIVNIYGGQTDVLQSDVVDFRRLTAPQGQITLVGAATVGASGASPGEVLSGVSLIGAPGIKAQIMKDGNGSANSYWLIVYGPRNVTSASINYTCGTSSDAYESLRLGFGTWSVRPTQVVQGPILLNQGVTNNVKTPAADPAFSSPTQQVAIGQPYHIFPFTLCRVDNTTSTESAPITGSISIDPLVIPQPAANAWPAGNYSTTIKPTSQNYYFTSAAAASPTLNITAPVYQLAKTPPATGSALTAAIQTSYTRIAGFVVDSSSDWQSFNQGVWRFSVYTSVNSSTVNNQVYLRATLYAYNNSTDPETGTVIAQVSDVSVANNYITANLSQGRTEFYMAVPATTVAAGTRLYLELEQRWAMSGLPGDVLTIEVSGDNPFVIESNVPVNTTVTTTVTNLAARYPAGSYPLTGTLNADPAIIDVAGEAQVLNPSATSFATTGLSEVKTIPVNFNLKMTVA